MIAFLCLLVLFLVGRPLLEARAVAPDFERRPRSRPASPIPRRPGTAVLGPEPAMPSMIDAAQMQGQEHAQSIHRRGARPQESERDRFLIRQWISSLRCDHN